MWLPGPIGDSGNPDRNSRNAPRFSERAQSSVNQDRRRPGGSRNPHPRILVAVLVANCPTLSDTRNNDGRLKTRASRPFRASEYPPVYARNSLLISRLGGSYTMIIDSVR